jgi:hypothetical protein
MVLARLSSYRRRKALEHPAGAVTTHRQPTFAKDQGMDSSPRRRLALVALTSTTLLAACGSSAPSNRAQIGALVRDEGITPASICHHLTTGLLVQFGGMSNCLSRAATAARDPSTHAGTVVVRGSTASATVIDHNGSRSITLIKRHGSWLISSVQ